MMAEMTNLLNHSIEIDFDVFVSFMVDEWIDNINVINSGIGGTYGK